MVLRLVEALAGVLLAAGGGYFAWMNRGSVDGMFPPEPGLSVWTFVAGLVASIAGAVAIVHAVGPRPKAKARRVEETQKRAQILRQAEQFYTAQAEDLATIGTNDGKPLFPEGLRPAGAPRRPVDAAPAAGKEQPPEPFRLHALNQPPAAPPAASAPPPRSVAPAAPPPVEPAVVAREAVPDSQPRAAVRPAPPAQLDPDTPAPARPFPAPVFAERLLRGRETPPPVHTTSTDVSAATAASTPVAMEATGDALPAEANGRADNSALEDIRSAIVENRLVEADRLLAATRKVMSENGASNAVELAQLTGLAGDHAAADGRLGSAKWLWRLALQRFAAAGAIDNPAAREVSERMRLADQ